MTYQNTFAGEYEGWSRLKLIQKVLRGLGSPVTTPGTDDSSDYSRYPKQDIIDKLIEAQVDFARKTECLTTFGIIEGVASQSEYRYPRNCLKVLEAKYYTATSEYEELVIKANRNQMKRISNTWREDSAGTPEYFYPSYNYGNIRKFGIYPKPLSSGTTFSGTSMGVVTSSTDFTFTGNITGTHNGAGNSPSLIDTTSNFVTSGAVVGMMLFNTTQGGKGQITAISTTTNPNDTLAVTLDSGDFDASDSYEVTAGEYGVLIDASGTESWVFSSNYGATQDITPLSGNILIDFVRRPMSLDYDDQIPEIPMDYQQALAEYAIWKLGGTEYDGFVAEKRSDQGKNAWYEYIDDYNSEGLIIAETDNTVEDREAEFFE